MKAIISIITVLFLSAFTLAPDQIRTISGTGSDEAGNPLAGVTVVVKGSTNGTLTDINGAFQLQVGQARVLEVFIRYVGNDRLSVVGAGFAKEMHGGDSLNIG